MYYSIPPIITIYSAAYSQSARYRREATNHGRALLLDGLNGVWMRHLFKFLTSSRSDPVVVVVVVVVIVVVVVAV